MPSELRPELTSGSDRTCVRGGTAYLMILTAVEQQQGLIAGKLHGHGAHCAIGSFFDINRKATVPWEIVNEVAAVNDSVPHFTEPARKRHVARWLKWKLATLGMPGFATAAKKLVGRRGKKK